MAMGQSERSGKTVAQRNKAIRQDALREQLSEQCRIQHIIKNIEKLEDLKSDLEGNDILRIKSANDQRIKLLGKYLPDLKATEITGPDGGDLAITQTVISFVSPKTD